MGKQLRLIAFSVAMVLATAASVAADYGTEGACAAVEAGFDATGLTTGVLGIEDVSWFLSDALLVGPELICLLAPDGTASCGAEGIEWSELPVIGRSEMTATVDVKGYGRVVLRRCP